MTARRELARTRPAEIQDRNTARAAFHLEQTDAWLANMHPEHFPPADVEPAP